MCDVADEVDATPARVALARLLHPDPVTPPIVGPRSTAQLRGTLGALDVGLPPEQVDRVAAAETPRYPPT